VGSAKHVPTKGSDPWNNKGYTTRAFFADSVTQKEYQLNCIRLQKGDIQRVKTLLSDGKHMAVAIMGPSHFTMGGHYIVLSGVTTNNGYNYFEVLDPHKNNQNYTNDGTMIYDAQKNGKVIARTSIFAAECQEYWVYSTINETSDIPLKNAMLNLENLGYSGLRNTSGELIVKRDEAFEKVVNLFLKDYNLTSEYNKLNSIDKNTILFTWIRQAVNGQIKPVDSSGKVDSETTTNNYLSEIFTNKSYDALAAVKYMTNLKYNSGDKEQEDNTDLYNKDEYERFDTNASKIYSLTRLTGDCANFVSQGLIAGGVKKNLFFHYYYPKDNPNNFFVERDMTAAWAQPQAQYEYFSNVKNHYTESDPIIFDKSTNISGFINDVKVGDLLFWGSDYKGSVHHATMITKIENGDIWYSGHTKNRIDASVKKALSQKDVSPPYILYIIKMNR